MEKDLIGRYVKYIKNSGDTWTIPEPKIGSYHMIIKNFGTIGDGWYIEGMAILASDFYHKAAFELMPKEFFPSHAKKAEMFPIY